MPIVIQLPSGNCVACERDTILIGRDGSCDVCLPNDDKVQPQHAKIRRMANRWLIESQGDWSIRVGASDPGRTAWLGPNESIRLTPNGPTLVFQPTTAKASGTTSATDTQLVDPDAGARLLAKRTERQILKTATLPQLYQQLGNQLADSRKYESDLPALYRQFDTLKEKISSLRAAQAEDGKESDLADDRAAMVERSQALGRKTNSVLSRLGKEAFEEFGNRSGPPNMVQAIETANAHLAELNAEIRDLRNAVNWPLTQLNVAIGVAGVILAAILYVLYLSIAY